MKTKMKFAENFSIVKIDEYLESKNRFDIFLCCGSFELRSIRSSEIFLTKNIEIRNSIIFNYKETDLENKKGENIKVIQRNLKKVSNIVSIFNTISLSYPTRGIKEFFKFLKERNIDLSDKKILIDITVFTKPYFFLIIKSLVEKWNNLEFFIVYTEPEKYKEKDIGSKEIILTRGLDRIESIPGFFGTSVNSKDALIVILGFEGKRAIQIFSDIDPEITFAVNGFPGFRAGWDKISLEENLQFLKISRAFENLFYAPARNPFETFNTISLLVESIQKQTYTYNIIIAPLGTKLHALGTLLYALVHKDIKIIYPFPSFYNADFSYRYGPTWILKINLKKLGYTPPNTLCELP